MKQILAGDRKMFLTGWSMRSAAAELFQILVSPLSWSAAAFTLASGLPLKYFIDALFRGSVGEWSSVGLVVLSSAGLVFVGLFLRTLIYERARLPDDWEQLTPKRKAVVKSPSQSEYLYGSFVSKRIAVVGGPSGSGKTTMLTDEIRDLVGAAGRVFVYVDSYVSPARDIVVQLRGARGISERELSDVNRFIAAGVPSNSSDLAAQMRQAADILLRVAQRVPLHLVLDQFEPELVGVTTSLTPFRIYENFFRRLVSSENIYLAVIVRKEWLWDATQFLSLLEVPYEIVTFPPADKFDDRVSEVNQADSSQAETVANWAADLQEAKVDNDLSFKIVHDLAARTNGFLKMEARIVSIVARYIYRGELTHSEYRRIGGVEGLIQLFFDKVLGAAPNENVATKILVALASERSGFSVVHSSLEIARLIHESEGRVAKNLEFLQRYGLVTTGNYVREGNGAPVSNGYLLRHDYVSEVARNSSAIHINSSDRDNIRTFAGDVLKGRSWESFIEYVSPREFTISRAFIALYILAALVSLLLTSFDPQRFLDRSEEAYASISAASTFGDKTKMYVAYTAAGSNPVWRQLDPSTFSLYQFVITISIFITQMLFLIYIDSINRGFLHVVGKRGVTEKGILRKSNYFQAIVVISALTAIYSIFAQPYFLFWTALCGVGIGLVQYVISNERRLSYESKAYIGTFGKKVAMNMAVCALLSTSVLLIAGYLAAFILQKPEVALGMYLGLTTCMVVFVAQIWRVHTSGEALSRRRAYYDRQVPSITED
jgi:hypothetical protein